MISIEQTYEHCVSHKQITAIPSSGASSNSFVKYEKDPFFERFHQGVSQQLSNALMEVCPEEFNPPQNDKSVQNEVSFVSVEDALRELQQMEKQGLIQPLS